MTSSSPEGQTQRMRATFDTIAKQYDVLRFVHVCARHLLEQAALQPGMRVLDVATGTGLVALAAAERVGSSGSVVGIDLSPEMLELARLKLVPNVANVSFHEGDTQHLNFPDGSFDAVLCASSLFFVPDMLGAVREWRRVLRSGGFAGFSSFGASFLQPLTTLWADVLARHEIRIPPLPTQRLAEPAMCEQLLREAGFTQMSVESTQLGYWLSAEQRWAELAAGLEGMPLHKLTHAQYLQIKAEYLDAISPLVTPQGVWVDVAANFAFGRIETGV